MKGEREDKLSKTWQLDSDLKKLFLLSFEGDKEAYRVFLHKVTILLKGYLFQHFHRYARNDEIKEELIQDILLLIHRKKSSYRSDMPVTPWLYTIAKHYMIDQCRKNRISISEIKEIENIKNENGKFSLEQTEDMLELNEFLGQLSEKQQQILIMSKGYGYTAEEINGYTGFSISSIKVSVHRSLKLLRKGIKS